MTSRLEMVTLQHLLFMPNALPVANPGRLGVPTLVEVGAEGTPFEAEINLTLTQHGVTVCSPVQKAD